MSRRCSNVARLGTPDLVPLSYALLGGRHKEGRSRGTGHDPTSRATSQLAIGGFFYACRSCEYLMVPQADKRRTNILRLCYLRFFKYRRELQHSDPYLEYAY